jgi:betaine-homocysteine S-methyltransferase
MSEPAASSSAGITERLRAGTVLGAEGYVFELERRGYIKAGPYVPEVVLDFPEAVTQLHREFLRAGRRKKNQASGVSGGGRRSPA